ncbi:MAG TPA: DUF2304 domain-containing protein [Thermoleophilaceae bacterium]
METRIQILAVAASGLLFLVVLELVRRRRLLERYALLWLLSAWVLLALAIWQGLLSDLARVIGIIYPPNALFLIAFGFVLVLLLHFSLAVSRLTDQTKVLAQRLAILEERQRRGVTEDSAQRDREEAVDFIAGPPRSR